jgi:hypothetical protein
MAGRALYEAIQNGRYAQDPHPAITMEDKANLMWYLQALGSAKSAASSGDPGGVHVYNEGSLLIEDPHGHLENFLNRADSYARSSSHLGEYQARGPEYRMRGADVRGTATPNGKRTILYGRVPTENQADPPADRPAGLPQHGPDGGKRMLFLKMEDHGCRGFTAGPPAQGARPNAFGAVGRFLSNAADFLAHAAGFGRSLLQKIGLMSQPAGNNKERVPGALKQGYQDLLAQAENFDPAIRTALNRGKPLSASGGIKAMLNGIDTAKAALAGHAGAGRPEAAALSQALDAMRDRLLAVGDHPRLRTGQEVILTAEETAGFGAETIAPLRQDSPTREYAASMSRQGQEISLAGYTHRAAEAQVTAASAGITDQQIRADAGRCSYTIGRAGQETTYPPSANGDSAMAALEALTNDVPYARGPLFALTHQGILSDITMEQTMRCRTETGAMLNSAAPQNTFGVTRMPDLADGTCVFRVHGESAVNLHEAMSDDGLITLGGSSGIHMATAVEIRIGPGGGPMALSYPEPPHYAVVLEPAAQAV